MVVYLIKGITRKATEVFTYPDVATANKDGETRFTDYPTIVASDESDLITQCRGQALVRLYNNLIDEGAAPVNKFTTNADGARRVFALLVEKYQHQPTEETKDVAPGDDKSAGAAQNEEDDMTKGKKAKKAPKDKKAPRVKKEKVARVKKDRSYKDKVISKGSDKSKADALALIERKHGATASEIAEKLDVSLGTAKNLVWYLRRDKHKIVVDKTSERRPYVIQ